MNKLAQRNIGIFMLLVDFASAVHVPTFRIKSTGTTSSPHCSFDSKCEFNEATWLECGNALCKSYGYSGASFVQLSNDFCTASWTTGGVYAYLVVQIKSVGFATVERNMPK